MLLRSERRSVSFSARGVELHGVTGIEIQLAEIPINNIMKDSELLHFFMD
jgi:hypothetical protein